MACEICSRLTHEWYDCPKKPDGYVPLARRERQKSEGAVHARKVDATLVVQFESGASSDSVSAAELKEVRPEQPSSVGMAMGKAELPDVAIAVNQEPPVEADLTKRGTPRQRAPKGTFDRKAWQRKYQERLRKDRRDHPEKYGKPAKGKSE